MKCKWCLFPHCFLVFGFCHCHSCHSHPFPSFPVIQVGGGGDKRAKCGLNEMFERMCAWDDQNYVMAAGTKAGRHVSCDRDGARSVERGQCRLFFVFLGQRLPLHCQVLSEMHMFFLAQCSDIKWFVSPNSVVGAGSDTNTTDGIVDGHAYTVITCLNDVAGTEQLNGSLRWWGARWHKQSVTVSSCSWFFWKESWRPSGFCRCPSLYYNL